MLFYYSSITCITSINQYDELFITNIVSDKYCISISYFQDFVFIF